MTESSHVYYLRREDDRSLYELGRRVRRWRPILGRGRSVCLSPAIPTQRIVGLLEVASLEDGWTPDATERGLYLLGRTREGYSLYLTLIVEDIRRWSARMPFRFIDERGFCDWEQPGSAWKLDDAIGGSRYDLLARAEISEPRTALPHG